MPGCSIKPPCRLNLVAVLSIWAFCCQAASLAQQQQSGPIRFFFDEGYFLEGETEIVRAYIAASNSRLEISGESTAAFLSVKGYYVPEKWDVYWTVRRSCHMAFPLMRPGQLVNCIPGVEAMSLKRTFIMTWQQAYGELAFNHIPRSYLLPEQYWLWRSHILAAAAADSKWVLKANVHRGKGVQVVTQHQALSQALLHKAGSSSSSSGGIEYHNVLIQQYCEPQMVIAGRSSYIRVWLLVTNITPLRAYLSKGGFAIFGKRKGNATAATAGTANNAAAAAAGSSGSGISNDDFIVNLWIQDRDKSPIWSLDQLEKYLDKHPGAVLPLPLEQAGSSSSSSGNSEGSAATADQSQQQHRRTFADAWRDIQAQSSLVLAAALPAMRAAAANSSAPDSGVFEYFGIDFVFDAYLRPWMLEVNAVPSMARRKRSGCAGSKSTDNCQLNTVAAAAASSSSNSKQVRGAADAADGFDEQKEQFVHDMMVLLGMPVDAPLAAAAAASVYNSSSSSDSSNQGQKSLSKPISGLELLQLAAAAAKGAEMPSNRNAGAAAGSSGSSGSSDSSGSSGGNTARLLLSNKRRISHLWKMGLPSQATAQASTPISSRSSSSATARIQQHQLRLLQQQTVRRKRHRHHHRPSPAAVAAATAAAAARAASATHRSDHQHDHPPAISLSDLPKSLHPLLCPSSSSSKRSGSESFGCVSCLNAADLAAVAAAEAELQRAGRFVPVYDLIQAHKLNSMAAGHQAAVGGGSESQPAAVSSSDNDAGSSSSSDVQEAAVASGAEYLSSDRSVWQRLYDTWTGLSTKGVGLRDLGIMKYYTTESEVKAAMVLNLSRQDYVMSAWLRVREKQQQQGGCLSRSSSSEGSVNRGSGVDCVILMLQQLVKECYMN